MSATVEFVDLDWDGRAIRIEYCRLQTAAAERPLLVFLHEGLGSLAMWKLDATCSVPQVASASSPTSARIWSVSICVIKVPARSIAGSGCGRQMTFKPNE